MARETGLILEGGGMRAIYTAGVLDCFMDAGVEFNHIYGVSAGACHACSYISGQKGRAMKTVTDFLGDKRYASFYSFLTTGDFFGVQFVYHDIPDRLLPFDHEAYEARGADFYAVVTNVETGEAEYHPVVDMRRDIILIQASSSLPLLSRMVEINGGKYLDGGIGDSIPLARSIADGHTRNLVVLTQHRGFRKKADSMLPLMKLKYRKYPRLVESLCRRHRQYNEALDLVEAEEAAGRAVVIRPESPLGVSRLEKDLTKLQEVHRRGYEDGKQAISKL